MKIIVFCNIPSPYRINFFNELGKTTELTVIFEAKKANGIKFDWNTDQIKNFEAVFLKEGNIREKSINFKIVKYIKKNYYDFIIMTNYSYFTELFALLLLKLRKIPYLLEIDGGIIRKENRIKKSFKSFLISNAMAYFSPSDKSDDYLTHYGAKKSNIYRYPFTSINQDSILEKPVTKSDKSQIKNKLGISEEKIILAIGQFIPRKGFDVLLKACQGLKEKTGVYIIGGEVNQDYKKLVSDLGLKNIYFKNFMDAEQLEKYYKIADVFVLPTREDIWGLVINEAMSFGLPVITTDNCIAGLELIVNGKNGYIIDVDDHKSLAEKMILILNDEELRYRMSLHSLNVIKFCTIENMSSVHMSTLKELRNKYQ